jgi:hypothetical protein
VGFLATVREFQRTSDQGTPTPEVKCDPGDGDAATHFHFAPPGTDAAPLAGDVAYLGDDLGAGTAQAIGYQDAKNAGVAAAGEHRLYARASDGTVVAELWLKGDGSIVVRSVLAGSSAELSAAGAIKLSNALGGLEIDAAGNVVATTPLGTFGAGTHGHNSPFGPIGPPIPGT